VRAARQPAAVRARIAGRVGLRRSHCDHPNTVATSAPGPTKGTTLRSSLWSATAGTCLLEERAVGGGDAGFDKLGAVLPVLVAHLDKFAVVAHTCAATQPR
jgi:hypothetical protein